MLGQQFDSKASGPAARMEIEAWRRMLRSMNEPYCARRTNSIEAAMKENEEDSKELRLLDAFAPVVPKSP